MESDAKAVCLLQELYSQAGDYKHIVKVSISKFDKRCRLLRPNVIILTRRVQKLIQLASAQLPDINLRVNKDLGADEYLYPTPCSRLLRKSVN